MGEDGVGKISGEAGRGEMIVQGGTEEKEKGRINHGGIILNVIVLKQTQIMDTKTFVNV